MHAIVVAFCRPQRETTTIGETTQRIIINLFIQAKKNHKPPTNVARAEVNFARIDDLLRAFICSAHLHSVGDASVCLVFRFAEALKNYQMPDCIHAMRVQLDKINLL